MLDVTFIEENPDKVIQNIQARGLKGPQYDVNAFLELNKKRKELIKQIDDLRKERNLISKFSQEDVRESVSQSRVEKAKLIRQQLKDLEDELKNIEAKWQWYLDWFPNMLDESVPFGLDENDNIEVKAWSPQKGYFSPNEIGKKDYSKAYMPRLPFTGKPHYQIGEELGIVDTKQSALVSGSRFYYLKKAGALLQFALFEYLKQKLLDEGFIPMIVPLIVKRRVLYGTSHFPGDEDQVYMLDKKGVEEREERFLVGSSEPSLFAYYMDKIVAEKDLPQKFFAITSCFRTEVGSWGKDVRGIKRAHQFDKLEMDLICAPYQSQEMHEYLLSINEWFLQSLGIPYHIILMCSGDAGYFATSKKYDFEAWLPVSGEFIELGSNTNAKDYQARRFNTKYKTRDGKLEFVHNVNDTGCAAGRTIIAILENYQREDGKVVVPEVLRKYMGGLEVIT